MKRFLQIASVLALLTSPVSAQGAKCDGPNNWPAANVFGAMKNAGIATNAEINFDRTVVKRIASDKIGKDLWRQVHLVKYYRKDGSTLKALAVSNASLEECSMSDVQTFVISEELSPAGEKVN